MSGSRSRRKGANGELEFARALPYEASRGRQYHGGPDSPDVRTDDGIAWEVKRTERLRASEALQQAERDASVDRVPAVAWRGNRQPWTILVRLDDLESLAARYLRACGWLLAKPSGSLQSDRPIREDLGSLIPQPPQPKDCYGWASAQIQRRKALERNGK